MRENAVDPDVVTYGTMLTACEGEDAFSTMRRLFDEMDAFGAYFFWRGPGGRGRVYIHSLAN